MCNIVVDATDRLHFVRLITEWLDRHAEGSIYTLPLETDGGNGKLKYLGVPERFLQVMTADGIGYQIVP